MNTYILIAIIFIQTYLIYRLEKELLQHNRREEKLLLALGVGYKQLGPNEITVKYTEENSEERSNVD